MGVSTDGILVFGIDLDEEVPEFLEEFENDFDEFLDSISGLPKYGEVGHDWDKTHEFRNNFPIDMTWHCSYDSPMYILSIRGTEHRNSRGYATEINPADLTVPQEKIDALKEFCEKYGIEYTEPKWLLVSMWG